MGRSDASKEQQSSRRKWFACLVYPTEEYYLEYLEKHNYKKFNIEPVNVYDGSRGWGTFDNTMFDILKDYMCDIYISPLHCYDKLISGEWDKPHFHILVVYDVQKSFDSQVKPFFESFGGVWNSKECQVVSAVKYGEYLTHSNKPEKFQYSSDDVISLNGADYIGLISKSVGSCRKELSEVFKFIRQYSVTSYARLVDYCCDYNETWFSLVNNNCLQVREYIKSYTYDAGLMNVKCGILQQDEKGHIVKLHIDDNGEIQEQRY